jgi:flagellar motor switch protein FliG
MIEGMDCMEEDTAAVSQVEEGNLQKLQETVTGWIKEHPNDAALVIRTWLLGTDYGKAAVLLVAIGSEISAEIFKHLREDEIETLTFGIARLGIIESDRKNGVLKEFHELMTANEFISVGGIEFAREVLEKSLGSQKAIDIINRLTMSLQVRPFDFIRRTDPAHLLNFIQAEHPQTIALVLAYLAPEKASVILHNLPGDIQGEVARRIAIMDRTSAEVLRERERVLEMKLSTLSGEECHAGGVESIVEILNKVGWATEKKIIEALENEDPGLADEIKKKIFVFEDIVMLDYRSIQKVLREVDSQELAKALKSVDTEVQDLVFRNMSKRFAGILKEDMEYMGPIRLKDVEDSQKKIISIIRHLEETGQIFIPRAGEDYLLGESLKSEFTWNDIPSLRYSKRAILLREVYHKTLVTALKLTRRDVFRKLTEPMKFFERFKLKLDIKKLKDLNADDVVEAQNEIVAIVGKLCLSETIEEPEDDLVIDNKSSSSDEREVLRD